MANPVSGRRSLQDVLSIYPGLPSAPAPQSVRQEPLGRDALLVVLDDDPTGTQSVADLPVLLRWRVEDFGWAMAQNAEAVYVETNTRGLGPAEAARINREVVLSAYEAAQKAGTSLTFVSRSDSTLRGHFPLETEAIIAAMSEAGAAPVDAVVIVPAFPAAGRVTVGGTHWIRNGDELTPVSETEYARDATFGFRTSDLREYVSQKSSGKYAPEDVAHLGLDLVRQGPRAVGDFFFAEFGGGPIVVDSLTDVDLDSVAAGLRRAEQEGKRFLYRVGPPFVRAKLRQIARTPLSAAEIFHRDKAPAPSGLVVIGSHVPLTTRQLNHLLERRGLTHVEIQIDRVIAEGGYDDYLAEVTGAVVAGLRQADTVVSTSRTLVTGTSAEESLRVSQRVSDFVVAVVADVVSQVKLRFVVAKGGITSSRVVAEGLGVTRAYVRGPMRPGIISMWELNDGPVAGIPYVVFPGNTGDDSDLSRVVSTLSAG